MNNADEYNLMLGEINNLITDAARDYGDGMPDPEAAEAKSIIAKLENDKIILPDEPVDFIIVDKEKYFKDIQTPDWLLEGIQSGYKFYYMRFPAELESKLRFHTVTIRMEFEKDENEKRPFFYKFFPNDQVKTILEGNFSGNVVVDTGFNFKPIPPNDITKAKVEGDLSLNLKFNFPFSFGKAVIEASPQGMNYAEWKFHSKDIQSKLENFAALLKVLNDAERITIKLTAKGTRTHQWIPDIVFKWIQKAYAKGDEKAKTFISQGLPYSPPDLSWQFQLKY
jgi:hypothetical protein